jgi:hypothetical protein
MADNEVRTDLVLVHSEATAFAASIGCKALAGAFGEQSQKGGR